MPVVQLATYRGRETAMVLQALADMASKGEVVGIAICYQTAGQEEQIAFTGPYKESPARAVNAAMRLSWRLTQMQEQEP